MPFEYLYLVVISLTTLLTIQELVKQNRKKVRDETHSILKRQLVYFFVVNSYEIPFKTFCLMLIWNISRLKAGTLSP